MNLKEKNKDVCITMPSNSDAEEIEMAKLTEKEKYSLTCLQIAVVKGHEEEIRALVAEFPEFLQTVNSREESLLHLALKYNQVGSFNVLMEEVRKRHLENLLINLKDHQGNTVLHIAVSNNLLEIVKLLLLSDGGARVQVDSKNNIGRTPLDLCCTLNSADSVSLEIGLLLNEARDVQELLSRLRLANSAREIGPNIYTARARARAVHEMKCNLQGLYLESQPLTETVPLSPKSPIAENITTRRPSRKWPMETRNVLLVVLVLFAGEAFNATLNPQAAFLNVHNSTNATMFHANEIVAGRLPLSFYYMVFVATIFAVAMGVIAVLVWALPFGAILQFAFAMAFIGYVIVVDKTMPKFSVKFGAKSISGFTLAWICVGAIIFGGVGLCVLVKHVLIFLEKKCLGNCRDKDNSCDDEAAEGIKIKA